MRVEDNSVLMRIVDLKKYFQFGKGFLLNRRVDYIKAVDGLTFEIYKGETLGLVGESGCGKSTVGNCILMLERPTTGNIVYTGINLTELSQRELRKFRRYIQPIFQDPYSSLNPRLTVERTLSEPIRIHKLAKKEEINERCAEVLRRVGLDPSILNRYPHEFSGGQRQRIVIARALALNPDFIVCDEPIASLDVSIQAQIVNLLKELQNQQGLTYLFIAHDLNMVRYISNRIAVMYLGKIVELSESDELYANPLHPYTQTLLSSIPIPNPHLERERQRIVLKGEIPSPFHVPSGCNFHTRCPVAIDICREVTPEFLQADPGHFVACHKVNS